MKNTKSFLMAIAVLAAASGPLSAGSFETDIRDIQANLASQPKPSAPVALEAAAEQGGNKWWSVNFFGSAHRAIIKASWKFLDKGAYPDMGAAKDDLYCGANDETGHLNVKFNGGHADELWKGDAVGYRGGVMKNYERFKFGDAYERLGAICHLTQDMAVPTHVANVLHGIGDSFEGFYDDTVNITSIHFSADLPPYGYYQALQDETRTKLPGWTDPATGRAYWVSAPDAPPLGQDATFGPWGHYGGKHNRDMWAVPPQNNNNDDYSNNNLWTSAHPEIRFQQLTAAGEATVRVLESASKLLPPLVADLSVSPVVEAGRTAALLRFGALDNRSAKVTYSIAVYKDGVLLGAGGSGEIALNAPGKKEIVRKGAAAVTWNGAVAGAPVDPGTYMLDVRLTDTDGNTTPDEVNADNYDHNDTRVAFTLNSFRGRQ